MRNYKKYRSTVIDLFKLFLAEKINKKGLINSLYSLESVISKGKETDKDVWFRFFENDTLCTTIANIDIDDRSDNYYNECMQIAINNPKGLQIYYS